MGDVGDLALRWRAESLDSLGLSPRNVLRNRPVSGRRIGVPPRWLHSIRWPHSTSALGDGPAAEAGRGGWSTGGLDLYSIEFELSLKSLHP